MRFLPLEKLINLHDGYRRRFKIDDLDLLLLQESGQVYAIHSRCPHQEHSLEAADVEDDTIFCPRHGYAFRLTDGRNEAGLCAGLKVWPTTYEGNSIGILLTP